jgi:hypothetical protein
MGIDIHALNFLVYVSRKKDLGSVATIGRQSLMVPRARAEFGNFCEELLRKQFGAKLVDSYDFSDFEGATYLADMNKPMATARQYDTVLDCGCTEHIFNVSQALTNISALCAVGGQIIHVSPANNFCGHGFWQFSPELFFSLYSDTNGYSETEVFLADLKNDRHWFQVKQPNAGERANVTTSSPLYLLCRTRKVSHASRNAVQQSDYVYSWEKRPLPTIQGGQVLQSLKTMVRNNPTVYRSALSVYVKTQARVRAMASPTSLSNRNRHLRKCVVSELLAS